MVQEGSDVRGGGAGGLALQHASKPCVRCRRRVLRCRYRSGVERVQPADVLDAARRRLHPAAQTVVVAGDAKSLRPKLEALGLPVEDLPLS